MPEQIPADAVDPTDGDILPDDVPDSAVIASALYQHLRDWDEAENLAGAVLTRLREYERVVARLPRGIARMEEVRSRVLASTPQVHQDWVDTALDEWHRVGLQEPDLLLDDQIRRMLAAVAPLIAPPGETGASCDGDRHAYAHYHDPRAGVFIPRCVGCGAFDWDDLGRQVAELQQQARDGERARVVAELGEKLERAGAAVLEQQWGHVPGTTHTRHEWENDCAVCRGDVAAILAVALPVLVGGDG